jgi:stress-induced morphogen
MAEAQSEGEKQLQQKLEATFSPHFVQVKDISGMSFCDSRACIPINRHHKAGVAQCTWWN